MIPEISVIIPQYNCSEYLPMLFENLIAQSFKDFEVIVVDDGSTDNSKEVLEKYKRRMNNLEVYYGSHWGEQRTRQSGFNLSQGKFVVFADADCYYASTYLEKLYNAIKTDDKIGFAYCDRIIALIQRPPDGEEYVRYIRKPALEFTHEFDFNAEKLRKGNYIAFPSLVRREAVVEFDSNIKRLQDWDFWLSIVDNGWSGIHVQSALFLMFLRPEGISGRGIKAWDDAVLYIKRKHGIKPV